MVHNFQVDDLHCYAVGPGQVLVHNNSMAEPPKSGTKRGGESEAAAKGREVHKDFGERVQAKPGWESNPRLTDPKTGRTVIPDAVTPSGRPVELKPDTPSGHAAGAAQMEKYERATGKKGKVVYYDPTSTDD